MYMPWLIIVWLHEKVIHKVVMVISSRESGAILERWSFDIKIVQSAEAYVFTE